MIAKAAELVMSSCIRSMSVFDRGVDSFFRLRGDLARPHRDSDLRLDIHHVQEVKDINHP
jgi:hypothetical protein